MSGQLSNQEIQISQLHAIVQEQRASGPTPEVAVDHSPRRRQRRLSVAQVAELAAAYRSGIAFNDLAARFKIRRSTVLDHLNRSDIPRRYPALDADQVEEAIFEPP